ncbi:MAG: hypothetical protein Q7U34_12280 [Anaerolineales bacterium]|nr:hypothetical protein [Anaerolineales bacterium]
MAPFRPSWRTRVLGWLARRFGAGTVLPTIIGMVQNSLRPGFDTLKG